MNKTILNPFENITLPLFLFKMTIPPLPDKGQSPYPDRHDFPLFTTNDVTTLLKQADPDKIHYCAIAS